jgi:hypothetical protein
MTSIIKVNNLQNQCGANTINKCGTAITVGASGDTVTLAAGASQSGFGQTYSAVSWDTTPKTGLFTAVSGVGYFCNTTSAPFTVTLPAGTAGDVIAFADYAATWQTNNLTVSPNGSEKIGSINADVTLSTEGQSVTFVYVDGIQGWINTMDSTSNVRGSAFIAATGGTITECGNFKIHTFTGPGDFTVTSAAVCASNNIVDYVVGAGGGSGSNRNCGNGPGGGGAGGFRYYANTTNNPQTGNPAVPINNFPSGTAVTVSSTSYPITIGAGGTSPTCSSPVGVCGTNGSNTVFSTIISAGGGFGAKAGQPSGSGDGGSGGGGPSNVFCLQGSGNTPPVSPSQGNPGGAIGDNAGGGGGGAMVAGSTAPPGTGGTGGAGAGITGFGTSGQVSGGKYYFAGGGGGGAKIENTVGGGGIGGGADGNPPSATSNGTANTGGGGGGGRGYPNPPGDALRGGAGGSGIVIVRYKFQ